MVLKLTRLLKIIIQAAVWILLCSIKITKIIISEYLKTLKILI